MPEERVILDYFILSEVDFEQSKQSDLEAKAKANNVKFRNYYNITYSK